MSEKRIGTSPSAVVIIILILFATTFGPITIRVAQLEGVSSLFIILVRLSLASLVMAPFVLQRDRAALQQMQWKDWGWAALAGLFLAINLLMLFLALEYTSVLVTGILRRITPLWVIGMEILFLATVFGRRVWVGMFVTIAGSIVVALGAEGAIEPGPEPALGASLALIGSICMGCYLLIGRKLRTVLPSMAYSWVVFSAAGLFTFVAVLATQTPLSGYTTSGYLWVLIVTIVSQGIGHVSLNMSLQFLPATYVSLIMQLSVVAGGVVAIFAFNQIPSLYQIIGSVAVTAGVMLVTWRR